MFLGLISLFFDIISESLLDNKLRLLFKRHARNPQRKTLAKRQFLSLDVLESVLYAGNVEDIRLVCDMSAANIVYRTRRAVKKGAGGIEVYDAFNFFREVDAVSILQDRMRESLFAKCPASKRRKFANPAKRSQRETTRHPA